MTEVEVKPEASNVDEGPEAAYAQSDLYADVMQDSKETISNGADGEQPVPGVQTVFMEYKSYTTTHPKSVEQQEKESKIAANVDYHPRGKQFYVGGLTWWTTDEQVGNAITQCGIADLISVKFFENRINGQSKGFAMVEVGSEASQKLCMERLSAHLIHGRNPVVDYVNKQSLTMFENQARKEIPGLAAAEKREDAFNNYSRKPKPAPVVPQQQAPPQIIAGLPPPGATIVNGPPPFMDPNFIQQPQPPQFIPHGQIPQGAVIVDAAGNFIQGGLPGQLPPGVVPQGLQPGLPMQAPVRPGVAPHINPAFINQDQAPPIDPVTGVPLQTAGLNQQDMESMRRNQAVASTAIQRAMTDANAGEFESGIETLVTAISLIKQSSTANTEPAQVLVQSLQDCLQGLEGQLVQKGSGGRGGGRYQNDYREHERGDKRRRRDRSRSRSRERGGGNRRSYSPRRSRSRERRRR
ncbi:cleavage and polyadenylation specificity factor subunit 6-like [Clytia hemisphaerica]|uniref:RRM domain-containing protein n=1 Tax=Clytia hemisphaerica TaxID=252671 RepID=A0A7M5U022_9CNID|eukprot:TCONS_00035432-protein